VGAVQDIASVARRGPIIVQIALSEHPAAEAQVAPPLRKLRKEY
jgi:hypothetical protein